MFHKIKHVSALPGYKLSIQFAEGVAKEYDVRPLFATLPVFRFFAEHPEEFRYVSVDTGGGMMNWIYPAMNYGNMASG